MITRFSIVLCGILLAGCASMRRSDRSGYAEEKLPAQVSRISDGSLGTDELSSPRRRLQILESRLESRREKEQYSKILPWINEDERMEFLRLPGVEARQAWINDNSIWKRAQSPDSETRETMNNGDISMGMAMEYVKKAWGEPQSVEVSGNPLYKNEKWKYMRSLSTQDGFRQEKRFVYFEGGRVVGWDTHDN